MGVGEAKCPSLNKRFIGETFMKSISSSYVGFIRVAGLLSLLAVFATPLNVMAAQPVSPTIQQQSGNSGSAKKIVQLQQKYFQIRRQLGQIEAKAVKSNPALVKKQQAFRAQLIGVMKKNGKDPKAMIASIRSLGKQMQDKKISASKRQQLLGKARQTEMELLGAERKAMQDPKIQAASKDLRTATLAAMRKVNPNTDKLIGEMRAVQQKIIKAHNGG